MCHKQKGPVQEFIHVKTPPKERVVTSFQWRNFIINLTYSVDMPPGEKDIPVLAAKLNDIKRFCENKSYQRTILELWPKR